MHELAPTHNKDCAGSITAENTPETTPRDLLASVATGRRTTVDRVRERLRGERDPEDVRGKDWFHAIRFVTEADEGLAADAELVLYCEERHPNAPDSVSVFAVDDHGRIRSIAWSEAFGPRRDRPPTMKRWRSTEAYAVFQDSDPEILLEADAKARYQRFVDEMVARLKQEGGKEVRRT